MYTIRYFFDYGSGVCLWPENEAAKARFGCPLDCDDLPASENTKKWLSHLIAWYDVSMDWDAPPRLLWLEDDWRAFHDAAAKGLRMLRTDLPPPDWEFVDGMARSKSSA